MVLNRTGSLAGAGSSPVLDAKYWRDHLRNAVRFSDSLDTLTAAGANVLLEVGPAPVLLGMARRALRSAGTDQGVTLAPSLSASRGKGADVEAVRACVDTLRRSGIVGAANAAAAEAAGAGDSATSGACVAGAAAWALVRVARTEEPELAGRLGAVDIDDGSSAAALLARLARTRDTAPLELAERAGQCLVPSLTPLAPRGQAACAPELSGDGVHLVSGGTGGLGLRVARWLLERGARSVLLLSRSGGGSAGAGTPSADMRALMAVAAVLGATVKVAKCDVCVDMDVREVLRREVAAAGGWVAGVMHAAGVLRDGPVLAAGVGAAVRDAFSAVLPPKLTGTEQLVRAAQDVNERAAPQRKLDFIVLFSSVASVLGLPAQGVYGAANAAMAAMALRMRQRGVPACAVHWGAWAEVGMAARTGTGRRARQRGLEEIPLPVALAALGWAVSEARRAGASTEAGTAHASADASFMVTPANWAMFAARSVPCERSFVDPSGGGDGGAGGSVAGAPADGGAAQGTDDAQLASEEDQTARCAGLVLEALADLGVDVDVDAAGATDGGASRSAFAALGIDSLAAMELRSTLTARLRLPHAGEHALRASMLEEHPTVGALAAHLAAAVAGAAPSAAARTPATARGNIAPAPAPAAAPLLQRLSAAAALGEELAGSAATFCAQHEPEMHARTAPLGATAGGAGVGLLVVLVGWAGSTPPQLARYVDAYTRRSSAGGGAAPGPCADHACDVLVLVPTVDARAHNERLAAELARRGAQRAYSGIVLHSFSTNGFTFLRELLSKGGAWVPLLRAVIVDSAPHAFADAAEVEATCTDAVVAHMRLQLGLPAAASARELAVLRAHAASEARRIMPLLWPRVVVPAGGDATTAPHVVDMGQCPMLLLYGRADALTSCAAVEAFVSARRHALPACTTRAVAFDSEHVCHAIQHPRAYWEHVRDLLDVALYPD
eukprot:g7183.t1